MCAILSRRDASKNSFKPIQNRHLLHYHLGFKLVESERQEIANPEIKEKAKLIARLWQGNRRAPSKAIQGKGIAFSYAQTPTGKRLVIEVDESPLK